MKIFAGGEEQHAAQLTVSSQGTINVPFIGSVKAEGLTVSQLERSITEPLAADYLVDPEITIAVNEYHSLQYYISGAVGAPGLYEMKSQPTLMELIAKAGGLTANRGNVAYILRPSNRPGAAQAKGAGSDAAKPPQKIDLKKLLDQGDMSQNIVLQSGDVVYVPLSTSLNMAESKVYVEGEVQSPGGLRLSGRHDRTQRVHNGRGVQQICGPESGADHPSGWRWTKSDQDRSRGCESG